MRHLTIGLFHDDSLGRELGKKGTESDIVMFNRKIGDDIFTFMSPVEDKLMPKSQIISSVDAAIVAFSGMTRELGESVVMLNSLGVSNGIAITSPYASTEQIAAITKGTALESYTITDRDPAKILQSLNAVQPARDLNSPVEIIVDHSFSVRGVGEVILGFVRKGTVRKYDTLRLLPANKEVMVRSVQLQDEDHDDAPAGARVGLSLKGATVDELKRGSILTASETVTTDTDLELSFEANPFYAEGMKQGAFHVTVGMQTLPVTITQVNGGSVRIESEKPVAHAQEDIFLFLDLNGKKTRIMGKGRSAQT